MKFIAGNWKMNGSRQALGEMQKSLATIKTENRVILCVPYTFIYGETGPAAIGAQDVSAHDHGAFTGEISAEMLKEAGAKYVIVGHSECRMYHGDTNEIVRHKAEMALSHGITPIICVGETMEERDAGKTLEIIESGVLESVPSAEAGDVIVAYEPRWAIGAGITPTDDQIASVHTLIAEILEKMGRGGTPILYGASVKGSNAAQIMSISHVDGVLVGGASLKPDDFIPIIMATK